MKKKPVILTAILCLAGGLLSAAPQPNIVHILTDDLGWVDPTSYYRAVLGKESVYETPNMDRLARNGRSFMQAYSPAPTCAPSRAAYMAGQYTARTGVLHVMGGRLARPYHPSHTVFAPFYPSRLNIDTPIIADALKEAGYLTAHIQKWHFGGRGKGYPGPVDYGFDFSWFGTQGTPYNDPELWDPSDKKTADYEGIWRPLQPNRISNFPSSRDPKDPYALDENDRPFDSVVDLSIRWMDKVKDQGKPFFVNFCPSFVHSPFSTRDRKRLEHYCEKMGVPFPTDPGRITDMEPGQTNPYYAAMLDSLDWQLGQILTFLETTDDPRNPGHKLIDNTYVMLSSDNGGLEASPIRDGKDQGQRERITDNTPLRGGKLTLFEGGIRIPFIIQGPGIEAGSTCETPINLIDMFPTYLAMAGTEPRPELELDGCNILPVVLGQESEVTYADGTVRDTLFWHYPDVMPSSSLIRKGGWKLRLNHAPDVNRLPKVMLYKLYDKDGRPADLGESKNLADMHPGKRDELLNELTAWMARHDAPLPYKNAQVQTQPGADRVPAPLKRQSEEDRLELQVETGEGKSRVVDAKLIYTTNGNDFLRDSKHVEEWFEAPAEIHDGVASASAPPGMTHGVFYLRDENGFLITSEPLPPFAGPGASDEAGSALLEDGYAYQPGLWALVKLAAKAEESAEQAGLDPSALRTIRKQAEQTLGSEGGAKAFSDALRTLRREIRALNIPEAKLAVLNQFETEKW